ncbi:MAG TPA: hypothetical protein VKS24_24760 [Bradyrhizobium sp.]|nr:hypothetical protein [Bradyrhizobium sp.]
MAEGTLDTTKLPYTVEIDDCGCGYHRYHIVGPGQIAITTFHSQDEAEEYAFNLSRAYLAGVAAALTTLKQ